MPPKIAKSRRKEPGWIAASCALCNASLEWQPPADQIECAVCGKQFAAPKVPAAAKPAAKSRRMGTDAKPLDTTYYELLQVPADADAAVIKSAYRRLSLRYHPDKNPGNADAEETFKRLAEAYSVLSDPERRAAYNRYGIQSAADAAAFVDPEKMFTTLLGGERFHDLIGDLSLGQEMAAALQKAEDDDGEGDAGKTKVLTPEQKTKRDADEKRKSEERAAARAKRVEMLTAKLVQKLAIFTEQDAHPDVERSVRAIWSIEADELRSESHGVELLHAIGGTYVAKARHYQASNTSFLGLGGFLHGVKSSAGVFGDTVSTLRAAMAVKAIFDEIAKAERNLSEEDKRKLEEKAAAKGLEALFKGARLEVESVLREVCDRILYDERISQAARDKRAEALLILGGVYTSVRADQAFDEAEYVKINASKSPPRSPPPPPTDKRASTGYSAPPPPRAPPQPNMQHQPRRPAPA